MALHEMSFTFPGEGDSDGISREWSHSGIVGSGDMEVLIRRDKLGGSVNINVVTPVRGYDEIWEKVLGKFVRDSRLSDLNISINDNNSTPFVVAMRLKQALLEAQEGGAQ